MIAPDLKDVIAALALEFDVQAVWLFGSAAEGETDARDIDLAVEGLSPERFFKFYARLFLALPKPVDLVDVSADPSMASIVRSTGVPIYERATGIPSRGR